MSSPQASPLSQEPESPESIPSQGSPLSPEWIQVFMYKVLNETLLTDMGRTKVRKHLKTTDAQAVWKDYSEYMTTASKGASDKRKLTHNF